MVPLCASVSGTALHVPGNTALWLFIQIPDQNDRPARWYVVAKLSPASDGKWSVPPFQVISGIYRWVDKIYTSQVYNYGKRLMFEFVLPEPAALFVKSRLAAYESSLDIPRYPKKAAVAGLPTWLLNLQPSQINEQAFREYAKRYDLSEFTYPQITRYLDFVDSTTGKDYFLRPSTERWERVGYPDLQVSGPGQGLSDS
jgi:hypothetical protein